MKSSLVVIAMAAVAVLPNAVGGSGRRDDSEPQVARKCSLEALGELLMIDSTKLVRATRFEIAVQNTEGASGRFYLDG